MVAKISGFIFLCSFLTIAWSTVLAQKKISKALLDSTKIKERQYKLAAKHSIDSARAFQKRKNDSISIKNNPDTIPFKRNIRVGFDLSKPLNSIVSKQRKQLEFSADYHWRSRYFLSAEAGLELVNISHAGFYNYSSTGEYLKVGFDYSIFRLERAYDNNIIYVGLRIAAANINYKAQDISIQEGYFGNTKAVLAPAAANAYWLEFLFGIKVEVVKRFSVGWALRIASQLSDLTTRPTYPIFIPGFGNSADTQNINYNFSVYYTF